MFFLCVLFYFFLCRSQEEVQRVDALAEEIGTIQSLRNSFNPILSVIVMALDAPAIFMRTKALRALGQIVTSDASVLSLVSGFSFGLLCLRVGIWWLISFSFDAGPFFSDLRL